MTETQERLNKWYDEKFQSVYPNLQRVEEGRRLLHRYAPDDAILEEIFTWVCEHNRYRDYYLRNKKAGDTWHPQLPNLYTFFSGSRWKDPIPSYTGKKIEEKNVDIFVETCKTPDCKNEAFNRKLCCKCYTKKNDPAIPEKVKEQLKKMHFTRDKGESWRNASMRCLKEAGLLHHLPAHLK